MKRGAAERPQASTGALSHLLSSPGADARPAPRDAAPAAVNAASPQARRVLSFSLFDGGGVSRLTLTTAPAFVGAGMQTLAVAHVGVGASALPACDGAALPAPQRQAVSETPDAFRTGPFSAWSRRRADDTAPSSPRATPPPALAEGAMREGADRWLAARLDLEGSERIDYLIHSLPLVVAAGWPCAVDMIFREVPIERLRAHAWQGGARLPHLVLRLGCRKLTRSVLADRRIKALLAHQDEEGMTPLHIAAAMSDAEAAGRIMDFRDLAASLAMKTDKQDRLALHHAAQAGANRVAEHLLSCSAREQRCRAARGSLALHIAVLHRQTGFIGILLREEPREQLLAPDACGRNALMQAVRWGAIDIVRQCLEAAAPREQLQVCDGDGMSALDHARAAGNREVLARIETAMRAAFPELAAAPGGEGGSPQGGEEGDGCAAETAGT